MRALILAAGRGTRLAGIANGLPKPLVPVGGTPVLVRAVRWVAAFGVERIWVNVHTGADAVRAALGDGSAFGVDIRYSHEPALLGTAGAWKKLEREWVDTSLVIYGDNFMHFDLAALSATHRACGCTGTAALFDPTVHTHTATAGGQAQLDPAGRIVAFREGGEPDAARPLVNAGAYLLEPDAADVMPAGFLDFGHDVLPRLAAAGRLQAHVLEPEGWCLGIDTPERLARAEALCSELEVRA
jgi:mannose-1-phosphate guanylyltransferase